MSLVMKRIKVYAKLSLMVATALIVLLVIFKNRHNVVTIWFFKQYEAVNVLWLMLCTAVATVLSWWVVFATVGVWRDMRDVNAADQKKRRDEDFQKRQEELVETEKRIDKKLKEALKKPEP